MPPTRKLSQQPSTDPNAIKPGTGVATSATPTPASPGKAKVIKTTVAPAAKPIAAPAPAQGSPEVNRATVATGKNVDELLDELRNTTDANLKKAIRRKLRAQGHFGGLGLRGASKSPSGGGTEQTED